MSVDPAVRFVRVAAVLSERFEEILKGPQTVSSRKQSGALVGFGGNQTEMSLRIGEAQQMYPEIWRNLDEARTAFAARGIDVAEYDAIRATEGQAIGAAVDIREQRHGFGSHAIDEQVKSANFNHAGLARAKQALASLMKATPEIDWAAIARAEAEDPDVRAFGRSTRIKRWISLSLLVLVLASPFVWLIRKNMASSDHHYNAEPKLVPDEDRAAVESLVKQFNTKLLAARTSWSTVMAPQALAAIVPGAQPCPMSFAAPEDPAKFIRKADGSALGTSTFASYGANEPIGDEQLSHLATIAERAARRLDRKQLADVSPYLVFFVIDHEVEPEITATAPQIVFTPGEVAGRAYVYSIDSATIVCAAKISVGNAQPSADLDTVRRKGEAADVLHRELEVRIRQALATELRRVAS